MSRYSLGAKVGEKAAFADQQRREKGCAGPEAYATDATLIKEAWTVGEANRKRKAEGTAQAPPKPPVRPPNSLFYKLYPQGEKDDATLNARKYWKQVNGKGEDDSSSAEAGEGGPPSDNAMAGALSALAFVAGAGGGGAAASSSSGGAPATGSGSSPAAPPGDCQKAAASSSAPAAGEGAADLKRSVLEAINAEIKGDGLREGMRVEIHGLKGAPELNGKAGMLEHLDAASGRWQVVVEDGIGAKKIKAVNLRERAPPEAPQATRGAPPSDAPPPDAEPEMHFL